MMRKQFRAFINEKLTLSDQSKIILTVSGGADSVVMLKLFSELDYNLIIAHCNFHLRSSESDDDEKFTESLAKYYGIPYFKKDFDTVEYAQLNKVSIEMAARDLRYIWFEQLRQELDFDFIATAHHLDDVIETFFINLSRGSGIKGLSGIKIINGPIIRPMLFTNRDSISEFCKKEKLLFREDSSNQDINIIRNNIRHQILPLFKQLNESAIENILKSIENLNDSEKLANNEINRAKASIVSTYKQIIRIDIEKLKKYTPVHAYLFEILNDYGFNNHQINNIEKISEESSGKLFYSKLHRLVKDRKELLISPVDYNEEFNLKIEENEKYKELPEGKKIFIKKILRTSDFIIPNELASIAIDSDKIEFPLIVRKWEQGDYFYPLGMNKKKKLSDYFIDNKYSIIDKQNALLLISKMQIVWIIGNRIDNRFKIGEKTKNILLLSIT
jgi:tRNA(Ile)-lysidine synthase